MIGCLGCEVAYSGKLTCHCAGCHATFADPEAFAAHRTGSAARRRCIPPAEVPLVPDRRSYACWKLAHQHVQPSEPTLF